MSSSPDPVEPCFVGVRRGDAQAPLRLEPQSILRHVMALGSSGSGKTVFAKVLTEEVARLGVPAICVDPQGDLCSLALPADDPEVLAEQGIDPEIARAFAEQVEVVIWTPAARSGVPLCADPIRSDLDGLSPRERTESISTMATMIVALLGYDLSNDEGEGLVAVFDRALTMRFEAGQFPGGLEAFSHWFTALDEDGLEPFTRYLNQRRIEAAVRRLARLDVGVRGKLFHEGLPLDIDLLLGRGPSAAATPGKVRLSVIYLNSLHSQEDKEFFLAALAERLYAWMLRNPSEDPQALFYVDEVAPFVPPVRKPACKPALTLLFKQARKYGIGCLMATQNPGDVDYRAMAQFGTWALGRLTTRQDLKKVEPTIKSLDPDGVEDIMATLPRQKPGEFILLSPDNFDRAPRLRVRWLLTRHETLDEDAITRLTDERHRARFETLEAERAGPQAAPPAPPEPEPLDGDGEAAESAPEDAPEAALSDSAPDDGETETERALAVLRKTGVALAREFAEALGCSESKARSLLKQLGQAGLVLSYKEGRANRYYASDAPIRPDLGLLEPLRAIAPRLGEDAARARGDRLRRRKALGLFGRSESLAAASLQWRLILCCPFKERVSRGLLSRLMGTSSDLMVDRLYFHPRSLDVLGFHPSDGISIHTRPDGYATEVDDFDGHVTFEERWPGELDLDEKEWGDRPQPEAVFERFRQRYEAEPKGLECIALPTWRFAFSEGAGEAKRIVVVDAVTGRELPW